MSTMKKPSTNIVISQLIVSFVQLSLICIVVMLEIPTLDFPKFSVFYFTEKIDYWKDLFYPTIDVPLNLIVFFFTVNTIFLLFVNSYLKHKKSALKISLWLCAINNILLFWACLFWVHSGLVCSVQVLNNADLFFCFDFLPPLIWQNIIGIVFSFLILALYTFLQKKITNIQLLNG